MASLSLTSVTLIIKTSHLLAQFAVCAPSFSWGKERRRGGGGGVH